MKNRLEISDLSLAYGKRTILEHISFTLAAGEAAALCGARLAFILPDGSQLILAPDEK